MRRVVGDELLGNALTADLDIRELSSLSGANKWYIARLTTGLKRSIDASEYRFIHSFISIRRRAA